MKLGVFPISLLQDMGTNLQTLHNFSESFAPTGSLSPSGNGEDQEHTSISECHGIWYSAILVVPSVLFAIYLVISAYKNMKKLFLGRSFLMISYYALLWITTVLNLAWCSLQAWECSSGKEVAWNLLSLFTLSGMLFLEISLIAFFLKENYSSGMDSLLHNFIISAILVGVDVLLKAIYVFGFGVPLFIGVSGSHWSKWGLWTIHKLLLTAAYGFILFVHFSKWRDKLPPRPAFYNYIAVMFVVSAFAFFSSGLAALGAGFGIWLYNFTVISYHSMYLPFLYVTFLADFFQEDDFLLENAYYSEMKDAGFFDEDWD